jgi:hypothetical protein
VFFVVAVPVARDVSDLQMHTHAAL